MAVVEAEGSASALPWQGLRILLVTPPMTQLNTPYPATAYLTGFLREHAARLDLELAQADLAIELFLRLFSSDGIATVAEELAARLDDTDEEPPASIAQSCTNASAASPCAT